MKTLFIIAGASNSGKTTLATIIAQELNIELISEQVYKTFDDMFSKVENLQSNYAIVEHCDILTYLNELKNFNIKIFTLKASAQILTKNYNNKILNNSKKESLNVNPVIKQQEILKLAPPKTILEINSCSDYDIVYNKIKESICLRLPKSKTNNNQKQQNSINKSKQFKQQYFDFYDDVKSNTHEVYDW